MTESSERGAGPVPPPPPRPVRRRPDFRAWLPTRVQALVLVIGLLSVSQALTFVQLREAAKPVVMTVGVREMTEKHLAQIARSDMTPQEAAIRTELFLAVSQDILKRAAVQKGVVVLARECVLAGEHGDATLEVARRVEAELAKADADAPALTKASAAPRPIGALTGRGP